MSNEAQTPEVIERQSLHVGKWGNLLMAVAGVVAAFLSNSDALLVDGLYSGVNFVSAIIAGQPVTMFLGALRQVAGASAESATVDRVREHLQEILKDQPFELVEVAVTKMGRSYFVVSYVKPDAAVDGVAADTLWQQLNICIQEVLGQAKTELVIAAQPPYGQGPSESND